MIAGIESREVDKWRSTVEDSIQSALDYGYGEYSTEDIRELCKQQQMQLWLFGDEKELKGCFVTQILNYPQKSVLLVLLLGGNDLKEHIGDIYELLNRFGKDKGCEVISIFGRKGWGNYLKDFKIKEKARMFTKEIL